MKERIVLVAMTVRALGLTTLCMLGLACSVDVPLARCAECESTCGDSRVGAGEFCDDGNRVAGDGCSSDCRLEPRDNAEVGCASPTSICGNDVREPTEQCDDANAESGDGCSAQCTLEAGPRDDAYYVSLEGDDSNGGRSEDDAFRTIGRGVSELGPGDTLYVKAGNYGDDRIGIDVVASAESPVLVEGYRVVPGDAPRLVNHGVSSALDPSVMPLIDGGDRSMGTGIGVGGATSPCGTFK